MKESTEPEKNRIKRRIRLNIWPFSKIIKRKVSKHGRQILDDKIKENYWLTGPHNIKKN